MDYFKNIDWNVADPLDLDNASDLIDSGLVKNILNEVRKDNGQPQLKLQVPLIPPSIPNSIGRQ